MYPAVQSQVRRQNTERHCWRQQEQHFPTWACNDGATQRNQISAQWCGKWRRMQVLGQMHECEALLSDAQQAVGVRSTAQVT